MATTLTSETKDVNRYLEPITAWEETEVPGYKTKVRQQLLEPWMKCVVLFLFMFTVGGILFSLLYQLSRKILGRTYAGIGVWLAYFLISWLFAARSAKKRLAKFVDQNNGEVGHYGKPYYKKVRRSAFFAFLVGAAVVACCIFVGRNTLATFLAGDVYAAHAFMFIAFYPFFYYLGTARSMNHLYGNVCPVCKRFEAVRTDKHATYGKNKEGEREVRTYGTRKIGEKITTTHWSDGSRTTSSSPIYGTVCTGSYYVEYGTKMADYVTYCRYCSYYKEHTEEERYSQKV